jgi:hypothetical protein
MEALLRACLAGGLFGKESIRRIKKGYRKFNASEK